MDHLISRGLANIENRFSRQVLRSDLVTHCPPPVSRPWDGASVGSAFWPRVGPSSAALLLVARGVSLMERTTRLDGSWTAIACASASPKLLESCCACTTSRSLGPEADDSRCFRARRAAQSTCGNSARFIRPHARTSTIHSGISSLGNSLISSRTHCRTTTPPRRASQQTRTRCSCHGCQR